MIIGFKELHMHLPIIRQYILWISDKICRFFILKKYELLSSVSEGEKKVLKDDLLHRYLQDWFIYGSIHAHASTHMC